MFAHTHMHGHAHACMHTNINTQHLTTENAGLGSMDGSGVKASPQLSEGPSVPGPRSWVVKKTSILEL